MEFKESQIPDDAINAKEIDSIAKFLAHVSFFSLLAVSYLLTEYFSRLTGVKVA